MRELCAVGYKRNSEFEMPHRLPDGVSRLILTVRGTLKSFENTAEPLAAIALIQAHLPGAPTNLAPIAEQFASSRV